MGAHDWYRNEKWDDGIAKAFFAKLNRARDKSQYLRIQAYHLTTSNPDVALHLLDQYFGIGDAFDVAQAYVDQAAAYETLENIDAAISSLNKALVREIDHPGYQTLAYLRLPTLIVQHGRTQEYDKALAVLDSNASSPGFPVQHYAWHGLRAIILDAKGLHAEARASAIMALDWASRTESGFRNHPKLGLVQGSDPIAPQVRAIAGLD